MEKKNLRVILTSTVASAALVASLGLAACAGGSAEEAPADDAAAAADTAAPAEDAAPEVGGDNAGFVETTIENADGDMLDGINVGGLIDVSGVYFQPVSMSPGQESTEGFDKIEELERQTKEILEVLKTDCEKGAVDRFAEPTFYVGLSNGKSICITPKCRTTTAWLKENLPEAYGD